MARSRFSQLWQQAFAYGVFDMRRGSALKPFTTLLFLLGSVYSSAGYAGSECVCVMEWIWGGCAQHECYTTIDPVPSPPSSPTPSRDYRVFGPGKTIKGNLTRDWSQTPPGECRSICNKDYGCRGYTTHQERGVWQCKTYSSISGTANSKNSGKRAYVKP